MIRKTFFLILVFLAGFYPLGVQPTLVPQVNTSLGEIGPGSLQPAAPVQTQPAVTPGDLQFPIRAAFYYPWFPEAWKQQGMKPFTHYHPALGYYSTDDLSVIKQHISEMQYGKIQAGISSWWGQGQPTDKRFPAMLNLGEQMGFYWALYMESEGAGDPSVDAIRSDLEYIRDHYAQSPAYLKVSGRFVVFVYAAPSDGCGMVTRWTQANTVGAYLVLKVFPYYQNCSAQPDGWHQYAPSVAEKKERNYSFTISPGFWKGTEGQPRLARDITQWEKDIRDMVASNANFQLITTFNEWGEGTAVENARQWNSSSSFGLYLDALHNDGNVPSDSQSNVPTPVITCNQELEYFFNYDYEDDNPGFLECFSYFGFVTQCQCGSY